MNRAKTDMQDAEMLARYCERMDFNAWQCPDKNRLALRAYSRRLGELKHQRARAKNQLHALQVTCAEFVEASAKRLLRCCRT